MAIDKNGFVKPAFENLPEEKRERILCAAKEEFANHGFGNTSIQQISKKAGISVGAIYKYFENKDALFHVIVEDGLSELKNMLTSLRETDEDIALKAQTIIRTILDFSRREPELVKLYLSLTADGNPEFLTSLSQSIEALSAGIYIDEIKSAQKIGDVRSDISPEFFAFLLDNIFVMLQYATACTYFKKRFEIYVGKSPEECEDMIVDQTLRFLKAAFNFK